MKLMAKPLLALPSQGSFCDHAELRKRRLRSKMSCVNLKLSPERDLYLYRMGGGGMYAIDLSLPNG